MTVNICGVTHNIKYKQDHFDTDLHLGRIDYAKAEIVINADAVSTIQHEALCHEITHGILVHIGRDDLSCDETFVQSLANAIAQTFTVRLEDCP